MKQHKVFFSFTYTIDSLQGKKEYICYLFLMQFKQYQRRCSFPVKIFSQWFLLIQFCLPGWACYGSCQTREVSQQGLVLSAIAPAFWNILLPELMMTPTPLAFHKAFCQGCEWPSFLAILTSMMMFISWLSYIFNSVLC